MDRTPHDPRSIANLIIDEGRRINCKITNLALQKLLYFAHAIVLIEQKTPLVSGYFEAWQYGPVHPVAYQAFKSAGDRPIEFRACRIDLMTGERSEILPPTDRDVQSHIERIINSYGRLTPSRLVDVSHAKGAPWDFVVDKGRTSVAFGLRITDNVIVERFKYHKVMVGKLPSTGDLGEDSPLA